jgi:hypothetical protein
MRIDSSGNLLVGTTSTILDGQENEQQGVDIRPEGFVKISRNNNHPLQLARTNSGELIKFRSNELTVGSIGATGGDFYLTKSGSNQTGIYFNELGMLPMTSGSISDNSRDIGQSGYRWNDLYLGGGVYLGGTGSANKLDDYEEGTWTVNIIKGGSALPVNTRYGYYTRIGNLIYIQFYWFYNGNLSSETNNSTQYKAIGMPYALKNLTDAAYAGIGSTYLTVNGTNYANDYYHKWQVNATDSLSLTGHAQTTQHSSGVLELSGAGVFRTT